MGPFYTMEPTIATSEAGSRCADAVAMGTRLIVSKESEFHPKYKDLICNATDRDTIFKTGGFGPIRLLKINTALIVEDYYQKKKNSSKKNNIRLLIG